jgi:hypothetical protein
MSESHYPDGACGRDPDPRTEPARGDRRPERFAMG